MKLPRPEEAAARWWPVAWLAASAAITWSVVRYELRIVITLTVVAVLLAWCLARRVDLRFDGRWAVAGTLATAGILTQVVPSFTYLSANHHRATLHVATAGALVAAVLYAWAHSRGRTSGLATAGLAGVVGVAALTYAVAATAVIRGDRHPRIDVWVSLQQASDGLAHGLDAYTMTWHGSPGVTDAFTYLPGTLVLLAPGRWLFGDVRWALAAWTLAAAGLVVALGRRADGTRRPSAYAAAALLLLMPGTWTQVEQAWTEPLLLALLAAWAVLVTRGRAWWAVVPLALALASKQHMVLLLPLLVCWPPFGWRRTATATGLAGAFMLPWFVASPSDMWHDTVTLLVHFHAIQFADTLYLASVHELGAAPPAWLPALVVVATVVAATRAVRRRRCSLSELLRSAALVLLVANLVNKQAFYNQFWLCLALVLLSLAGEPRQVGQPSVREGVLGDAEDRAEGRPQRAVR